MEIDWNNLDVISCISSAIGGVVVGWYGFKALWWVMRLPFRRRRRFEAGVNQMRNDIDQAWDAVERLKAVASGIDSRSLADLSNLTCKMGVVCDRLDAIEEATLSEKEHPGAKDGLSLAATEMLGKTRVFDYLEKEGKLKRAKNALRHDYSSEDVKKVIGNWGHPPGWLGNQNFAGERAEAMASPKSCVISMPTAADAIEGATDE